MAKKKVKVVLEVDDTFVRLLQANVQLSGWLGEPPPNRRGQLTASAVLAVLVLGEARGATEEQIDEKMPDEWRGHIQVLHAERAVREVS